MAQRPPQGSSQVHVACGEDGTRGQRTGSEEAKVGPVEQQSGCTSQPGFGPDPGDKTQVWQLGFGWSEMRPVQLQHLPEQMQQITFSGLQMLIMFAKFLCSSTATETRNT